MKAVIDTCVIIDALQNREPFREDAQALFLLCANCRYEGFITAKAMTDIYYLSHRLTHSDDATRTILSKLCALFGLLDTAAIDIRKALLSEMSDFEDGVMVQTAVRCSADCIVTRNLGDYAKAPIPVYTPGEFVSMVEQGDE